MKNRNIAIDFAKWFFAFLVVTLHTSFWHSYLLAPIARCAVPFFYMVTGYFVLNTSRENILKTSKKWLVMWIKYSLILLAIGCLWNWCSGNHVTWSCRDTIDLVISGSNSFIDEHVYNGDTYGFSTLWFLYAGFLALMLYYIIYRQLYKKGVDVIMVILLFGSVITNYLFKIQYDESLRLVFLAIPFMYMGGRFRHIRLKKINAKLFLIIVFLLWIIGLFEIDYVKTNKVVVQNIYLSCIPLSLIVFYVIANSSLTVSNKIMRYFPVSSTLDVYIWHRLVYFILVLLGCYIGVVGSIEVFLVTASLSIIIKQIRNEK